GARPSEPIESANHGSAGPPTADSDCARARRSSTITVVSTAMASTTITVRTHRLRGLPPAPRGWGPGPVSGGVAAVIGILGDVPWNGPADHAGGTHPPAPFAGGVCSG